ncbi:thy-1 membrane glycoprotein [Aplochiton taeniatus]
MMYYLATICFLGFAATQKVIQVSYCSIDEHHLRMDCKYEPAADSPDPVCKYTQGGKVLDTTDPEEQQDPAFQKRAKVLIMKGNSCRLRFNNLPNGKTNFTCTIKQTQSADKLKTVEKKLLLPCSALSVLLESCSGLLLTLMTIPVLLGLHGL